MATLYAYSPNGTQATLPVNVMGFTQSLATNGWCKLPNGLIFQWRSSSGNWAIAFSAVYGGGFCGEWYCYTTVTAYYRITTTKSDSKTVDGSENISKVDYSFAIGK